MEEILIVVDLQNDFVDGSLGSKEAVAIVPNVVKKINAFEGRVIATLDTHGSDYLTTSEGRHLPVPHCVKGTEGWCLTPPVAKALEGREVTYIEKGTFGSLALPGRIGDAPRRITLIGLCTDICVVSNALILKSAFPETVIAVDADCCAGVTPEAHFSALETMRSCQIEILQEGT